MERVCPKCDKRYPVEFAICPEDGERLILMKDPELSVGEVVDERYRILSLLDKGGMGAVYRAYQLLMDREVAFKVVNPQAVADPRTVKRFFVEAKAASKLTHPNTITVFDFGQTQAGMLFMAMELVKGHSLNAIIQAKGTLPVARSVHIVSQVCDSISEAHSMGVIHRDLKPDNILIEKKQWEPDFVKVLDFGIAKLIGGSEGGSVTKTGIICGTPKYMSPEAISGLTVGPPADLYALAIVLYEMLSGAPPFMADTQMKLFMRHIREKPRSLFASGSKLDIPRTLDRFILRALSKEPKKRPQSAQQFKQELLASVEGFVSAPAPLRSVVRTSGASRGGAVGESTDEFFLSEGGAQAPAAAPTSPDVEAPNDDEAFAAMFGPSPARKWLPIGAAALAGLVLLVVSLLWMGSAAPPSETAGSTQERAHDVVDVGPPAALAGAYDVVEVSRGEGADTAAPDAAPAPSLAVRLQSVPAGARVRDGERAVCETPCDLSYAERRRGETLRLMLSLEGYALRELDVTLGDKDLWTAALSPLIAPAPTLSAPKSAVKRPDPIPRAKPKTRPKAKPKAKPKVKPSIDIDIEPASF
jgi:hypothetical protein